VAKKYYWLKLKDNFFTQREIKKLRKIAGGDTFTIIYLKMQLLSIKNEGRLTFEGTEQSMLDQLELELDEDRENIELTMAYLQNNKLLEIDNDDYFLPKACESIGKESESAERVRRHRAKKLLQGNGKALQGNKCNVTSNTEIELEIEKEIEKEIENPLVRERVPYEDIKDLFISTCTKLPKIKQLTEPRKNRLKKIYFEEAEENIIFFKELFETVAKSDFLNGKSERGWRADFDWILKPANLIRILEGKYESIKPEQKSQYADLTGAGGGEW